MSNDDPGAPPEPPGPWRPPTTPPPGPYVPPPPDAPASAPYGQPNPAYGSYGYGYPGAAPPQTEGTAIGALIAAGVSWFVCPIIPAIVALFLASSAKQKIAESGGRLTGDGLVTAARWVAWLNIGLWGLGILLLLFVALIAVLSGSTDGSEFN